MADGTLKVGTIITSSGSGTITLGQSGETITIPTGATATGFPDNTPMFLAVPSSNQAVDSTTNTLITFGTEVVDTDNAFASNKFTVPTGKGGKYFLYSSVRVNDMGDADEVQLSFKKNGGYNFPVGGVDYYSVSNSVQGAAGSIYFTHSLIAVLAAGDYIENAIYHNYGSSRNINYTYTRFGGYRIIGA